VPPDPTLPPPGWYPDPYEIGWQRWFDGSEWSVHAIAADTADPDRPVERDWPGLTDGESERHEQFSSSDRTFPHEGEARNDGGGGGQGLYANRVGRGVMRAGMRWGPARASRWLGGLTLLLTICAWGDPAHRVFLAPAAAVSLVATVVFTVREARERAYWRKVGRHD
jgi:Protein of unknown function (DUF2510)